MDSEMKYLKVTMSNMILLLIFIGWTFTSFACHFCAKKFINTSSAFMPEIEYSAIILTLLQVFFYTQVISFTEVNNKDIMVHKLVVITVHTCATLATNWSMALTYAASTFAIKLMEPVTSALIQTIFLKVKFTFLQWISIPAVVSGAIAFAKENNTATFDFSKGTVLAFISNICLSLRNTYMKKNHLSNSKYKLPNTCLKIGISFCTIGFLFLYTLSKNVAEKVGNFEIYIFLLGSSLFHAIYSYISTVIVLHHYSVVGHAFGNILKRLAVLVLLYMTGSRTASLSNFIGLTICLAGLAVYAFSEVKEQKQNHSCKDLKTFFAPMSKVKQLLFALVAFTIIVLLPLYPFFGIHEKYLSVKKYQTVYGEGENLNRTSLTLGPNVSLSKQVTFDIKDFFSVDLTNNPDEANKLSPLLTKRPDVIDEAQRIHMNIFKTLFDGYRYAMLFDYSPSENKGDSALVVGETLLLRKLNIEVVFACKLVCNKSELDSAQNISRRYTNRNLVILFHGGGNIIGYPMVDFSRSDQIKRFMHFNIVMFPQSILYIKRESHIKFCQTLYSSHPRLTFIWRDIVSFNLGKKLFPKVRSLLSPDIAYQIGFVPRFMAPTFDILWIQRSDKESPRYNASKAQKGLRMHVSDWLKWYTPPGDSPMENTFLMTTNGMMFLQRGRVVITDRLHGHILSTLLNIPHVYIDNEQRKITNYHNTWTAGLDNIVLANSSDDAVVKARELLIKLDKELPSIKGFFL